MRQQLSTGSLAQLKTPPPTGQSWKQRQAHGTTHRHHPQALSPNKQAPNSPFLPVHRRRDTPAAPTPEGAQKRGITADGQKDARPHEHTRWAGRVWTAT